MSILETIARQAAVTEHTDHRPWRLPDAPWVQAQTWEDLAFLHWRVDEAELRRRVPDSVTLETYDGGAWLGVTPFLLTGFRLRGLPPLPRFSTFPELNVRTYVTRDDRPGIWFFSLDAANRFVVEAARRLYKLPYEHARMSCTRRDDWVEYASDRGGASFSASYRGTGELFHAEPGTLEHFLTERYCLYTEDGGRLFRVDIQHPPWSLQHGDARLARNTIAPVPLPDEQPHVLFAPRQDVVAWSLVELQ